MAKQHINSFRLMEIPIELMVEILCQLPDFTSLFSAIQCCRRFRDVYQQDSQRILLAILHIFYDTTVSACNGITKVLGVQPELSKLESLRYKRLFDQVVIATKRSIVAIEDLEAISIVAWQLSEGENLASNRTRGHTLRLGNQDDSAEHLLKMVSEADCVSFKEPWSPSLRSQYYFRMEATRQVFEMHSESERDLTLAFVWQRLQISTGSS